MSDKPEGKWYMASKPNSNVIQISRNPADLPAGVNVAKLSQKPTLSSICTQIKHGMVVVEHDTGDQK